MNLRKMSLAAVVVASLGTASVADVMISGNSDFRFESVDFGPVDKFSKDKVDIDLKSHSADKMGMVHVKVRHDKGALSVNKLYAKYSLMGISVGAGPKIAAGGKFSDTTNAGIVVSKKMMGTKLTFAMLRQGELAKKLVSVSGKAAMINYALDFQMGDAKQYLATVIKANLGAASIGVGYAMDTMTMNTMMGASAKIKMGAIGASAGLTISGVDADPASVRKERHIMEKKGTDTPQELGYYYGSQDAGVMAFYARAGMKVAGVKVGAYGSMAGTKISYQVNAVKKLNAQSTAKLFFTGKIDGETSGTTTEVRLSTKF